MRSIILACALLVTSQIAGCGSSFTESRSAEVYPSSKVRPANPDLLSTDGELFPLSSFFGICVRYKGIWQATLHNRPVGPHYPTDGEIILAGGVKLNIGVGKFDMRPGTVLKDIPATSPPRRVQIASLYGDKTVLVSDFDGAGNNRASIDYDEKDVDAEAAAIRFANSVVACHVSAAAP